MAKDSFQVETYSYYFWSSRKTGKANLNLKGGSKTCSVWFEEDEGAALKPATKSGDYMQFWYHYSQLDALIDMLRNEGPISVFFDDDGGFPNSMISTTQEPAGEGEVT